MSAPARILLLGDPVLRPEGLERALARAGYRVTEVNDALAEPAADLDPDLVLLTAEQAGEGVTAVLDTIAYGLGPAVPVLVTLSAGTAEDVAATLGAGAADVMLAPVHVPELLARMARRRRHAPAGAAPEPPAIDQALALVRTVARTRRGDELVQQLCEQVASALDLARCAFILTPEHARGRIIAEAPGRPNRDSHVDLERYPEVQEARRTGEVVVVGDIGADPLFELLRRGGARNGLEGLQSVAAIPVRTGGDILGVFVLRPADPRVRLRREQLTFADALAQAAAEVLAPVERAEVSGTLEDRLAEELERARRYALGFSVVLLGLDADDNGTGMADLLRDTLRAPDVLFPYGRGEYALLLPETSADGARASVLRLRARMAQAGAAPEPAITAGIASFPHPAVQGADDLIALVEAAHRRAHHSGGERIGVAV